MAVDAIGGSAASTELALHSLRLALQQGQAVAALVTQATQQAKQVNASGSAHPNLGKSLDIEA
ncbi:MAG: hypothetical protein QGI63_11820 [Rhodospirillales bacterium]|jgi:hypothetical protein|nr:hypothetical protein [Rhodospirillales bacterium]